MLRPFRMIQLSLLLMSQSHLRQFQLPSLHVLPHLCRQCNRHPVGSGSRPRADKLAVKLPVGISLGMQIGMRHGFGILHIGMKVHGLNVGVIHGHGHPVGMMHLGVSVNGLAQIMLISLKVVIVMLRTPLLKQSR